MTARKRTTEYVKALCERFDEKKTRQNSITARFMGKLLPETICFVAGSVFLMTCFRALFHQARHHSFAFHAFCLKAESGFPIVWPAVCIFRLIGWLQIRCRAFPSRLRRYKEDLSAIWAARLGTGRKTAHVDDCARKRAKHLLAFLAFDPQRHRGRFLLGSRR